MKGRYCSYRLLLLLVISLHCLIRIDSYVTSIRSSRLTCSRNLMSSSSTINSYLQASSIDNINHDIWSHKYNNKENKLMRFLKKIMTVTGINRSMERPSQWINKSKKTIANLVLFFAVTYSTVARAYDGGSIKKVKDKGNTNTLTSTKGTDKVSIKETKKKISNIEVVIEDNIGNKLETVKSKLKSALSNVKNPIPQSVQEQFTKVKDEFRRSKEIHALEEIEHDVGVEVVRSWKSLADSLQGAKLDTLFLLIATSAVIPLSKRLKASPILGFLLTGTILGPTGLNWIRDVHMIDMLGELGIVFFLFEMGLELSIEKLIKMRKDVFGLGTSQFLVTAAAATGLARAAGLSTAAAVTIGGSLSLSSSAFVLQLLKDKNSMGSRHGKAAFGILLLQDLAVVPLLVVVELLGKGGAGLGKALTIAGVKTLVTVASMSWIGRRIFDPIFYFVAKSASQEAFLSIILCTVLLMSFVTQGIGLSNTLGAFLAGLLLSETKYHYQIETDIAPFRGLLLGFFFITVGFSIDINLLLNKAPIICAMLATLILGKASIITALSVLFKVPLKDAQQAGWLTSQGGEFAFVAFGIAERMGILTPELNKLLLTTVALSMAATPALAELGSFVSEKMEENMGLSHVVGLDSAADEVKTGANENDFVLVCGYGRVGKMVCDILDRKFIRYIALDNSPQKAIDARSKGLPVFFGDINRPEVLKSFNAGTAKACVLTIDDMTATNKAVIQIKKEYPNLPLVVRAKDAMHQERLTSMFEDVDAFSPILPEDSVLLTLPFGGAVLQKIGVSKPEIQAILEDFRKTYMSSNEESAFDFLSMFQTRLPPSIEEQEKKPDVAEKSSEQEEQENDMVAQSEAGVFISPEIFSEIEIATSPSLGEEERNNTQDYIFPQ